MATLLNQGTLRFTPRGGTQTSVISNTTSTALEITYALEVSHGASPETYVVGDTIRYTVLLRNTGSGSLFLPAVNVDLADGALDYVEGSAVAFLYADGNVTEYPFTVTQNGGVTFSFAQPLTASNMAMIVYDTVVKQNSAAQSISVCRDAESCEIVSTATATANEGTSTGPEISGSDTATITCKPVTVIKSAPDSVEVGDTIRYVFSITNNTSSLVALDSLADQLPEQFSLTAVTLTASGTETALIEGSDYTITDAGLLTVDPTPSYSLPAGETVLLTVVGVVTA